MGPWEIAVLAAAIAVVAGVIAKGIWNKKGGCCGDCSHCGSCRRIRHPENSEK